MSNILTFIEFRTLQFQLNILRKISLFVNCHPIILALLCAFLTQWSLGQSEIKADLNYINYTLKDGLPSNETYDLFLDSKGYIWIATDNGVVKFDGKKFKTYTTRDGLTDNTIFKISEDNLGRIWFLTFNRTLCYYENNGFHPFEYNQQLNEALKKIRINQVYTSFHRSEDGTINIGLVNFAHVSISKNGIITLKNKFKDSYQVDNDLFFFNSSSLENTFRDVAPITEDFPQQNKFIIQTKNWGNIHIVRNKNHLYFGTKEGLFQKNDNLEYSSFLKNFYITGVLYDNEDGLWCSTLKHGVLYIPNPNIHLISPFDPTTQNFVTIIPQGQKLVFPISKDGTNNWYYSDSSNSIFPYPKKLNASLLPHSEKSRGIKFEERIFFENIGSPNTGVINTVSASPTYFSNHGFLVQKQQTLEEFYKTDLTDFNLSKPGIHSTWYSRKDRLFAIKKSDPTIINLAFLAPSNIKILKALRLKNGEILVGTTKGLYHLNEQTLKILKYPNKYKFSDFRIQDILQTNDGSILFATKSQGIYTLQNNMELNLLAKDGLTSNTINKMAYDSTTNTVYAGTNNGLTKLNQKRDLTWVPTPIITEYDGLASHDIRSLYLKGQNLFFTNNSGLYIIDTKYLTSFSSIPKLYLTECKVNSVPIHPQNLKNLSYNQNTINFSFTGISFKTKSELIYKYQLNTQEEKWNETSNSQLNFNALKPGNYTLRVVAKDQFGNLSTPQVFSFSILPAFWMTWWFYLIVIVIGLLVVYYISSKSIEIYKNQAKFQRSLKEMHVVSLQSKMNPHFIFNSLNSIQNYILKNERMKANEYLLEFSTLIRSILQNSEHTSITLLKELETLRMYVELEKKRIRKEFQYVEKIDPEIDANLCTIPTLLIQPYIENAIWHGKVYTNTNGKIEVCICKKNESLHFEISDNGIGIENAEKSKIRVKGYKSIGSEATKKRIQLLSELNNDITEVKISKNNPEENEFPGTVITFSVPFKETIVMND